MQKKLISYYQNNWTDFDVESHWDSVADIYISENEKVKIAHDQRFKETIRHLNLEDFQKVLVISSRDCEANDYLLEEKQTVDVVNAEISQGLINQARRIRPYAEQIKIESYSKLNFDNESFDRIVCLETLEHVDNPFLFLMELNRVVKSGGLMVLSCPPASSEIPYQIFSFLFGGHGEGPHKFPSSKRVKMLLKQTGWKLKHHKGTVLIPIGPPQLQEFGDKVLKLFAHTFIAELGIRQFYVAEK